MSTYLDIQNRINSDCLNRTDFVAETKRAIQAAIRHHQYQRWPFNETATALTTSAGQSFVSFPSNFLVLDDVRLTINSEDVYLIPEDPQYIRDANTANTPGQPTHYAIYQNRINFFPVPDSAWPVPIYYLKSLTELSADTDTNAWITGALEDVITYHAAKLMWANVLRNEKEAMKFAGLERLSLTTANSHKEQQRVVRLRSTRF